MPVRDARRPRRVSAAAVAREAGVSPAAVSYVMNGRPGVSSETRALVLETAERLGHTPSEQAARLRSRRTRVIGLVVTDLANPFYTEVAAGAIDAARDRGYEVFVAHTQEDPDTLRSVTDAMVARGVDGVMLTVLHPDDGDVIRALRSAHIPFIQLSRRIAPVEADFVGIDDHAAAAELMRHLLAHGYREMVTVVGPRESSASAAREEGFAAAAREAGVRLRSSGRISTYLSVDGGFRAAERVLARGAMPQALVCGSDVIAMGALAALRAHSVAVPDAVAVTGFDGLFPSATPLVELTTVEQPRREMATEALDLLVGRIEGTGGSYQHVVRDHRLRIGTTCGCPPGPADGAG